MRVRARGRGQTRAVVPERSQRARLGEVGQVGVEPHAERHTTVGRECCGHRGREGHERAHLHLQRLVHHHDGVAALVELVSHRQHLRLLEKEDVLGDVARDEADEVLALVALLRRPDEGTRCGSDIVVTVLERRAGVHHRLSRVDRPVAVVVADNTALGDLNHQRHVERAQRRHLELERVARGDVKRRAVTRRGRARGGRDGLALHVGVELHIRVAVQVG